MYRIYFMIPVTTEMYDHDGFKAWADFVAERVSPECLEYGVGYADLFETQPIWTNTYKGIAYFDFVGRIEGFDALNKNKQLPELLDKMLDFTNVPPLIQGVFFDKE
jgi:hypothetical protein